MGSLLAAALLASLPAASTGQPAPDSPPALWADLTPGPYRPGYRQLDVAHGVVHVWYPSEADGPALLFREYLGDGADRLAAFLESTGLATGTVDSLFDIPLYAIPSPAPLAQARPLVLIAQGNGGDVIDQVVLCEYLASRGFVAATTPSPMLDTPLEREDQVGAFAEKQAADLEAAIGTVAEAAPVDTMHIGVVGYSFGARAALLLAMNDARIRAIVSFDGGIGTATAVELFRLTPSFQAGADLPPLLHFYEDLDGFMTPDFDLLESLDTEELVLVPTNGMHHVHFTTYGFLVGMFPTLSVLTQATEATVPGATDVLEKTADFLERGLD